MKAYACSIEGCDDPVRGQGLCSRHYRAASRRGEIQPLIRPTVTERLLARRRITPDGCWLFTGALTKGYGNIRHKGRTWLTHRLAYELLVGPVDDGLTLDHLCRNKACFNPDHLEPVTLAENVRRAARGKTHCPLGHPYDEVNTYLRKSGWRGCRACHRAEEAARNARLRSGKS